MIREGAIHLPFRYAAGKSASRYFVALREKNIILGSRCSVCERILAPARSFCPTCADADLEDLEIGPCGELVSWTHVPGRGTFGLILLDKADTAMVHRILGESSALAHGARVRARFTSAPEDKPFDCLAGFEVEEATP